MALMGELAECDEDEEVRMDFPPLATSLGVSGLIRTATWTWVDGVDMLSCVFDDGVEKLD